LRALLCAPAAYLLTQPALRLPPGGLRIYEDRGGGGRVEAAPGEGRAKRENRLARAFAALASSGSDGEPSDSASESGSGSEEESESEDGSSSDSDTWTGQLLDTDDAAMADYAANAGVDGAHARLIAQMSLGGEGARHAPSKARFLEGDATESEEEDEEGEEGEPRAHGWGWHTGGRAVRRGAQPGESARASTRTKPRAPGEKARKRTEGIQAKRSERAVKGGFDAAKVCDAMSSFVAAEGDMMALKPGGKFQLKVTSALAALHGLRCTFQGSGKKQFAVLRMTSGACVPEGDNPGLLALLRYGREGDAEEPGGGDGGRKRRHLAAPTPRGSAGQGKAPKIGGAASAPSRARLTRMSFVSGGRIGGDGEEHEAPEGAEEALDSRFAAVQVTAAAAAMAIPATKAPHANRGLRRAEEAAERERLKLERRHARRTAHTPQLSASAPATHGDFGDFERHTTGFGSRMLSKMGFLGAGTGLGSAGQGRAEPILVSKRGKGVGLGAE